MIAKANQTSDTIPTAIKLVIITALYKSERTIRLSRKGQQVFFRILLSSGSS